MVFKINLEVLHSHLLARNSKLKTKHGKILLPTLFPVHDMGSSGFGHTPAFWKLFPEIKTCMFNASNVRSNEKLVKILTKRGIHKFIEFNGAVFVDSGGWTYRRNNFSFSQEQILRLQEDIDADIASTLDFPIKIHNPSSNDISLSVINAIRAAKLRKDNQMLLFASIHGNDPVIIRNIVRYLSRKADFDGFALGSLMPMYGNYSLLIDLVLSLRCEVPKKLIHVYGLAGPIISQLLAFLGVDTMDSTSFLISASKKAYVTPGLKRIYPLLNNKSKIEPNCKCSVCKKYPFESVLQSRELLSLHNLWTTWNGMEQFKIALKENRLKEYMKYLFLKNEWAKKALQYALYKMR